MTRLILASSSPRRQELLKQAGYDFEIFTPRPEAEAEQWEGEPAADYVVRMARQKAEDVAVRIPGEQSSSEPTTIIGCDTVVIANGQILGKPSDGQHARQMLQTLRGTVHHVISGLCLLNVPKGDRVERVETTTLQMAEVSDAELQDYLESNLWQGKAGGFGYQDRTGWLEIVQGSESNVVGLPLETLMQLLPR